VLALPLPDVVTKDEEDCGAVDICNVEVPSDGGTTCWVVDACGSWRGEAEASDGDGATAAAALPPSYERPHQASGRQSGKEEAVYGMKPDHFHIFTQAFTLTFLAEWGDRSQIATIALASSKNPYGVILGGLVGHAFCTALAVVGGRMLAARISERTVALVGGVLFLLFAVHSFFTGVE